MFDYLQLPDDIKYHIKRMHNFTRFKNRIKNIEKKLKFPSRLYENSDENYIIQIDENIRHSWCIYTPSWSLSITRAYGLMFKTNTGGYMITSPNQNIENPYHYSINYDHTDNGI
jgi:hypothetical protein